MKHTLVMLIVAGLTATSVYAEEGAADQQESLLELGIEFAQTASLYDGMVQGKLVELALELSRDGRLDSEESAKEAAANANAILKDIGVLYGDFLQARVRFMLEVKNVLTPEQKVYLLSNLHPDTLFDFEEIDFLQPSLFDLPVNLSSDQRRKLAKLEADLRVKEVKLERDIALILLDLEDLFLGESIEPAKVDKQIMELAGLAADAIENRVDYMIDAKDVLTLDQKRLLAYLMGL